MIKFVRTSSQYLSTSGNYTVPFPSGTVMFWLTPFSFTSFNYLVIVGSETFSMRLNSSKQVQAGLLRHSAKKISSVSTLTANIRYHVAVSYNDTGSQTTNSIYINGVLDKSDSDNDGTATTVPLIVGSASYIGEYLDGLMEDLRIYDRVLPLEEIQTIYEVQGTDGIVDGLVGRWLMGEGAPTTVASSIKDETGAADFGSTNSPTYDNIRVKRRRVP